MEYTTPQLANVTDQIWTALREACNGNCQCLKTGPSKGNFNETTHYRLIYSNVIVSKPLLQLTKSDSLSLALLLIDKPHAFRFCKENVHVVELLKFLRDLVAMLFSKQMGDIATSDVEQITEENNENEHLNNKLSEINLSLKKPSYGFEDTIFGHLSDEKKGSFNFNLTTKVKDFIPIQHATTSLKYLLERFCLQLLQLAVSFISLTCHPDGSPEITDQQKNTHPLVYSHSVAVVCDILGYFLKNNACRSRTINDDTVSAKNKDNDIFLDNIEWIKAINSLRWEIVLEGVYVSSVHMIKQPWTSALSRQSADLLLRICVRMTGNTSVKQMLTGEGIDDDDIDRQRSLLKQIMMKKIGSSFTRENWKLDLSLKHSFAWLLTNSQYPRPIPLVVGCSLLLLDDFELHNKLLGLTCIEHILGNSNVSDIKLYNHHRVIYDALFKQLFSNEDEIFRLAIPCLYKVLMVIERKPDVVKAIKYNDWDRTYEQLMKCAEFENRLSMRRIVTHNIPMFVEAMSVNTIKHFSRSLRVICVFFEFSDGDGEKSRLNALRWLNTLLRIAWPSVKEEDQRTLLKALLKLLVDVHSPDYMDDVNKESFKKIESVTKSTLMLMLKCFGESITHQLHYVVTHASVNQCFLPVVQIIEEVVRLAETDLGHHLPTNFTNTEDE